VDGAIWKIHPDGSGEVKLSSLKSGQQHIGQFWSPDSQHLAFTERTRTTTKSKGVTYTSYTYDILRISANGGTATNLTGDTAADCWSIGWR
jgi:Tol biopolymer transport system component